VSTAGTQGPESLKRQSISLFVLGLDWPWTQVDSNKICFFALVVSRLPLPVFSIEKGHFYQVDD